jgi:hypothetical protein
MRRASEPLSRDGMCHIVRRPAYCCRMRRWSVLALSLVGCGPMIRPLPIDPPTNTTLPAPATTIAPPPAMVVPISLAGPIDTIDRALALLADQQYEDLMRTVVDPEDLARLTQGSSIAERVQKFVRDGKDKRLYDLLTSAKTHVPKMDPSQHTATYETSQQRTLVLHEINGRWYIKD